MATDGRPTPDRSLGAPARVFPADVPASGAWQPEMPPGRRQFVEFAHDYPFALEGGGSLRGISVAYETWGELDATASNAVLVCHALTGDSHAAGPSGGGHPTAGWWEDLIGPGRPLDTDRHFVVCVNVLGGCQGTTGPASTDPTTGTRYASTFPVVTIRDMVRVQARVADHLGVGRWLSVIGGSMGGMQVLQWTAAYPERVFSALPVACSTRHSAQNIAFHELGRQAVMADPDWHHGRYFERSTHPHRGLAVARAIAQITYRSDDVFRERFDRDRIDSIDAFAMWDRFQVEGYLDYHGLKLARRFDANSYLLLNKAMDLHDIGRGRGGVASAMRRIVAPTLSVSVSSDTLYHPHLQREFHEQLLANGTPSEYHMIDSPHGHDGFLIEFDRLAPIIADFLKRIEKTDG